MENKDYIKGIITGIFLAVAGILLGLLIYQKTRTEHYVLSDPSRMARLQSLEDLIDEYYLNEKDEEKLAQGIYHGIVYGLEDPYSRYYSPEEYESELTVSGGSYEGIGVSMMQLEDGTIEIVEVYPGTPGEEVGLQPGDIVLSADDLSAAEVGLTEIVSYIKGGGHSEVTLTIRRGEQEDIKVTVPVAYVELPSVSSEIIRDGIGYIQITEFKGVTTDQFERVYRNLREQGIEKLIIDLRNNPGGYLTSVCDILRMILPEGLIVYTEDKYGKREEELCSGDTPIDIPLAVLVNEGSASASEIFAGAVQDHGVGKIVGRTTFGKGIVQSIRSFADGSAIKLTVSHYYTPNGHDIHDVGIHPDVPVEDKEIEEASSDVDVYIEKAIRAME